MSGYKFKSKNKKNKIFVALSLLIFLTFIFEPMISVNTKAATTIDYRVQDAQKWLNATYTGKNGYEPVAEDGHTGQSVVTALITALQIEIGVDAPTGSFGPATQSSCPTITSSSTQSNIIKILQYGLYCKGYNAGTVDGTMNSKTLEAVKKVETDAGFDATGVVTPVLFKAILNTDPYVLISGGDSTIQTIQRYLNRNYSEYFGIKPCSGVYSRDTNKALIYALQAEEGYSVADATGSFGSGTTEKCPTLSSGDMGSYVRILEYALYCNGYNPIDLSGSYSTDVESAVSEFQSFMCLDVTGVADMRTIKGLLTSNGDTTRTGTSCDCATILNQSKIDLIKSNGYKYVGRYLTGTVGGTTSKAMTKSEANLIINSGLKIVPIYQDGGNKVEKFTAEDGNSAALKAIQAAANLGIPNGSTIYFAVDFDCYDYQVTNNIIPYFKAINDRIQALGSLYKVGIYAPRNVCTRISNLGYASTCYVSDMSTGFSGNLGYKMPSNWAFDQIFGYSIGVGTTDCFGIDKVIASGRDSGVSYLSSNAAKQYNEAITIAEHSGYYAADPVDVSSGAHVITYDTLKVNGEQELAVQMSYSSDSLAKGSMGVGWYYNYEKSIVKTEEGYKLYQNPSSYLLYTPKEGSKNTYICNSLGRQNDLLMINGDGTYKVNCNGETIYTFDSSGRLICESDKNGLSYNITYDTSSVKISESVSGKYIVLTKNAGGLVTSITDQEGNQCVLTYDDNSFLTSISDANGDTTKYTYDDVGRVLTGTDNDGVCYFTDSYDSLGRIVKQYDGISGSKPTEFAYDDSATNGTTIVTVTDRNGNKRKHVFNSKRLLTELTDENGNVTAYTYDENGNVNSKKDALGNIETSEYNSNNKIIAQKHKNGSLTKYAYDTNGNLIKKDYANGASEVLEYSGNKMISSTDVKGLVTKYEYFDNGLVSKKTVGDALYQYTYEDGLVKTITAPDGGVTTYYYDQSGNMLGNMNAEGKLTKQTIDARGQLLSITNAEGATSSYTYNCRGKAITHTDANGNITTIAYNGNGKMTSETDAEGKRIVYEYDSEDRLIKTTDRNGKVTTIAYDPAGQMLSQTDAEGGITTFSYDAVGNLTKKIDPSGNYFVRMYDANGNVLTETDANGITTKYAYDTMSKVIKLTNAQGGETSYVLDNAGNVIKTTDPLGNVTETQYDSNGKIISQTDAKGNITKNLYDNCQNLIKITDALGGETTYSYDKCGDRISATNANGQTTTFTFDDCGRCVSVTDALNHTRTIVYDANGNVIKTTNEMGNTIAKTTYNALNQAIKTEDALGNEITVKYDAAGNLIEKTDALGNKTTYEYDNLKRIVQSTNALNEVSKTAYDKDGKVTALKGPLGSTVGYAYDSSGRLISETTTSNATITYSYDSKNGLLSEKANGRGQKSDYTYDQSGRIASIKNKEGTITYAYDANGNAIETTDKTGTVKKSYDVLNRVIECTNIRNCSSRIPCDVTNDGEVDIYDILAIQRHILGKVVLTGDDLIAADTTGDGIVDIYDILTIQRIILGYPETVANKTVTSVIKYTYDAVGNITDMTYPDGSVVKYSYDAENRMVKVEDWNGKITSYEYDATGNITKMSRSDGSILTKNYDTAGRLIAAVDKAANGVLISSYEYNYDKNGNILSELSKTENIRYEMTYDKLNRVISRKKTNVNSSQVINQENFTYDAAGNITSAANNGTTSAMTYDANNHLTDASGAKFEYDKDGNMTSGLINGRSTVLTYDSSNRLLEAGSKEYVYDAENVRLSIADGANKTTYVYNTVSNLSQLLTSTDEKGNVIKYVYGAGSLISQETANGYSYFHYDLRGSTIALTNATGVITNTYEYDAYGKVKITKGDNITPFLYNGRDGIMTEDNGLLYMRARYYSPDLKRFVNADILAGDIKNSSTLNQYAYVEGNPISMVDPFGLCAEPGSSGNLWSKMTSGIGNYFSSWSFSDVGHTFLDGAGMIPGIGFAFDGSNALWYLAVGDNINAGLSATALLPFVGEAAGGGKIGARVVSKAVGKSVKYSDKMVEATELAVKNEDKIADIGKIADDVVEGAADANENIIYRALNQKDAERLSQGLGLEAKNPTGTWKLDEHLVGGSSKASWANDPFISTTTDIDVARGFNQSGSNLGIVKIDLDKVPSQALKGYEIYPRVNGVEGLPYHYSIWQQETSVYQNIPIEAIKGFVK